MLTSRPIRAWWATLLACALIASACSSGQPDDGTASTGDPKQTSAAGSIGGTLQTFAPGGAVSVELSAGQSRSVESGESLAVATGEPLDDAAVDAIFERLPAWEEIASDTEDFNRPAETLPPPLVGETIDATFPPAEDPGNGAPEVPDGPLEVVRFQPEGDVPLAPYLSITFNQPMVPLATLEALEAVDVPVTISPELPGRWQWIGTRTLRFDHTSEEMDRLPMATSYTATVPAGTTSETGGVLADEVTWTFTTPTVQVQSFEPESESLGLEPVFLATFDQRIDAEALLAAITLKADGDEQTIRIATDAEITADELIKNRVAAQLEGRWIAFRATEPFKPDTAIEVELGPDLPSVEGPLTDTGTKKYTARTYAPLKVIDQSCNDGEQCRPGQGFWVGFNNELDPEQFDPSTIEISPDLPGATIFASGNSITVRGATKGRTTYEVTLPDSLSDTFGQTLNGDKKVEFKIGEARPALAQFPNQLITLDPLTAAQTINVQSINHTTLKVRAFDVQPGEWAAFIRFYEGQWDREPVAAPSAWNTAAEFTVQTDAQDDQLTETAIDLSDAFDGEHGHLVIEIKPDENIDPDSEDWWQNRPVIAWVQSTDIGVDAIADPDDLVVWTTDLSTGAPLEGVEVQLAGSQSGASTGADGLATIALGVQADLLTASKGDDTAILQGGWERVPRSDQAIWYVFDDRGTYRPGETVRVKGWVRALGLSGDAQLALLDEGTNVGITVSDWQGNQLTTDSIPINNLGGFDFEFAIPEGANLGEAQIVLSLGGGASLDAEFWHAFQIQDFRRPEFEVSTRTESPGPFVVGEPAVAAVDATYFSGGPLPAAEVEWQVTTRTATYSPPGNDDYTFGVWIPWWFATEGGFSGRGVFVGDDVGFGPPFDDSAKVETFAGVTDGDGSHFLQMDFGGDGDGLPTTVRAQATVLDVNRQAWSSTTELLVHPADRYVGLRSDRTFVRKGEPLVIEGIVTDIDGAPVQDWAFTMEAGRLVWRYENGEWTEEPVDTEVCKVTSAAGPVECSFKTDEGGRYRIVAVVIDSEGRQNRTEFTRWVSGGDAKPVRNVEREDLTLIPDAQDYAPGDSAEVLVQAPFGPGTGLMTVSRNGVVSTETFTVDDDGSTVLTIAITETHVPNVHVQVDVVGASERTADDGTPLPDAPGRPAFATGQLNLPVPPISRTLDIMVEPTDELAEPGADTSVAITVTDADGAPVADAQLAVVVADEAVLALSGYELTDPNEVFYRTIPSEIWTQYGRESILLSNPDDLLGGIDGGTDDATAKGGPETEAMADDASDADLALPTAPAPTAASRSAISNQAAGEKYASGAAVEVRKNFDALAVFAPEVTTDQSGKATIDVPLPDSLTRYRVMVVAVDGDDQFGAGEANITARLPLMVRPSAPRFLNFGDEFALPVVIQNQTDGPLDVDVALQTSNLELTDGDGRSVTVPPNDRIEVRFPARAVQAGTARFRVAATSGTMADAATTTLPVYTPVTTEAFATYGVVDDGAVLQPVAAPVGVVPQFGGLEVNTSSTALQALTDAVLYLSEYRYESSDAFASRIMAISALRDVLEAFQAEGLPTPAELEATIQNDIAGLVALQNGDGGFAGWSRSRPSVPYNSIQAVHSLIVARENGYSVPPQPIEFGLDYLRNIENYLSDEYSERTRYFVTAYALHVRALAGDRSSDEADALYQRAGDDLGLDAAAWLWPVIDDETTRTGIARLFANRAAETAGAATFTDDYGEDAYLVLHSDRRTDGIVLNALISEDPESDLIPKVVAGLLAGQKKGRWRNVQENTFVLLALNEYFDTFEAVTPDFVARIWLGDLYAGEHVYDGRTTNRIETVVPMTDLIEQGATSGSGGTTDLVVAKDGPGRLYYRLGLRYAPDDLKLDPLDRGFVVQRTYESVDDPGDVTRDADGTWRVKAGAKVRIKLTMVAESQRTHVALVDPLPAGLEALNPALAVTGDISQDLEGEELEGDSDIAGPSPSSSSSWWWSQWYEHQNLRDDRAEAFATYVSAGTYDYTYIARATTPGTFVVPPTKAEQIYEPESFGRSSSDTVVVTDQ